MRPRQLLGVIVRAGGLVLLFISANDLFHMVARPFGYPSKFPFAVELVAAFYYFGTGYVLTRYAESIVRFAYGPETDISN